ncbi:MAG: hypothetical protein QW617_01625 [Acidilobaceae archaeon]
MTGADIEELKGVLDYLIKHYEKLENLEKRLSKLAEPDVEAMRLKIWKIALGGLISKLKAFIDDLSRSENIAAVMDACKLRDEVSNLLREYSSEEDLIAPVRAALVKVYAEVLELCGEVPES